MAAKREGSGSKFESDGSNGDESARVGEVAGVGMWVGMERRWAVQ